MTIEEEFKVGDEIAYKSRGIFAVLEIGKIVRETPTMFVVQFGNKFEKKFRKKDNRWHDSETYGWVKKATDEDRKIVRTVSLRRKMRDLVDELETKIGSMEEEDLKKIEEFLKGFQNEES